MRLSLIFHPAVFLLATFLVGCGGGSIVGRRYDNFTAYYNGFYNAERVYADGTSSIGQSTGDLDRTRFVSLFNRPTGNTGSREFESAIKKSADLLRQHPNSKWVDDALLLIGKSYFFQENFVGAGQKFEEVISLGTKLEPEARFWLARTLITSGAFEEAQAELSQALALEDVDREYRALFHLAMGELYVKQSLWAQAAEELGVGLEDVKDKEIGARAQFLHGQVLEKEGRYEESAAAYRRVSRFNPTYELKYAADYSAIRVTGAYIDPAEALADVRRMERDDKNVSYLAELRYLRARTLQAAGEDNEAFRLYDELLYDPNPSPNLSSVRGRVHYALAELYRDEDGDYVKAAAHFDTAATALGARPGGRSTAAQIRPGFRESPAPEAIVEIDEMRDSFKRFATVYNTIEKQDSLLYLGQLPQDAFDERVLELRQLRAAEIAEQQRLLAERQRDRQFQQQSGSGTSGFQNQGLPPGKVIPGVNDGTTGNTAGFLYHEDPIRVQEGRATFREVWGNRPLVPNWRRADAVTGAVSDGGEADAAAERAIEEFDPSTLPEIDTSAIPRDSTSQSEMRGERALARYELGNILFLNMSEPDSAIVWYRKVIEDDADQQVAQRALYALAEVQRALGDDDAATTLYRQIVDRYPASDFAGRVRERLGLDDDVAAVADSAALASQAYGVAYSDWNVKPDSVVLGAFLRVAADWQPDESAAKAMLAAARLHLEMADSDSSMVVGPVRAVIADSVLRVLWPDRWNVSEAPDSVAVPDSVATTDEMAAPDSVATIGEVAAPDSVATTDEMAAPDSVAVPDSVATIGEVAAPDSVAVPDSVATTGEVAAPDSVFSLPADSVAIAVTDKPVESEESVDPTVPVVRLTDLYEWVRANYRGTPYYSAADAQLTAYKTLTEPPPKEVPVGERTLSAADSLALVAMGRVPGRAVPVAPPPGAESPVDAPADSLAESDPRSEVLPEDGDEDILVAIPDEAFEQRDDLRPLVDDEDLEMDARGFYLVVGRSVPNINGIRRNQQLLSRGLMTDASLVTVLATTGTGLREYQIGIGPFEDRRTAELFYAGKTRIITGAVGLVELTEAP